MTSAVVIGQVDHDRARLDRERIVGGQAEQLQHSRSSEFKALQLADAPEHCAEQVATGLGWTVESLKVTVVVTTVSIRTLSASVPSNSGGLDQVQQVRVGIVGLVLPQLPA